jgi:hypothetical protein
MISPFPSSPQCTFINLSCRNDGSLDKISLGCGGMGTTKLLPDFPLMGEIGANERLKGGAIRAMICHIW